MSPDDALSVDQYYDIVTATLEGSLGRTKERWVRGEIVKVYEKTHCYLDVADANSTDQRRPTLNAHSWATQWRAQKKTLADQGITLAPGMVVTLQGYVDVYAPQGRIGFTITAIHAGEVVGELAKRRAELLQRLSAEGLLATNKTMVRPSVPLRVGLVASAGTEGFNDFTGQLLSSGLSFEIVHINSLVQGESAPPALIRAIRTLETTDVDIICLVRGGGSKADLACFDDETLARAIAACAKPVFTGIGHTGDESIADLVAHTAAITPTKLGELIVEMVSSWRVQHVTTVARDIREMSRALLEEAEVVVATTRRTIVLSLRDRLRVAAEQLRFCAYRIRERAGAQLETARRDLQTTQLQLAAHDPVRTLARGYALVTTAEGRLVRTVDDAAIGSPVTIHVSAGTLGATITHKEST